jgi:hypothetical protein
MRTTFTLAALAIGVALAAGPALAQDAPLSPGGISAAANAYGGPGPGQIGPRAQSAQTQTSRAQGRSLYNSARGAAPVAAPSLNYNAGLNGAPLSPGGISAAADAYGGPGYNR